MARIAIMALEGMEEEVVEETVVDEGQIETELAESEETDSEIDDTQDTIEEATDTNEALGEIADVLEEPAAPAAEVAETPAADAVDVEKATDANVEADAAAVADAGTVEVAEPEARDVSPETAEVARIAVEHFLNRLGYKRKKMTAALESFGKSKEANTNTLKQLRIAQEEVGKRIVIAQEGIFDRFVNSIKQAFQTTAKIKSAVAANLAKLESDGSSEEVIKSPGWGRAFAKDGATELSGTDAINALTSYNKLLNSSELLKVISGYKALIQKVAAPDATAKADALLTEADGLTKKYEEVLLSQDRSKSKSDPSFKPLSVEEGKKLAKIADMVLEGSKVDTSLKELLSAMEESDINKSSVVTTKVNPVIIDILSIVKHKSTICYASANYIKASTGKAKPAAKE